MSMKVSLPSELADFVKAKVAAGRYASSSEVVREALRLMERVEQQDAEKLAYLRKAWQDGIDSGEPEELDFQALKAEGRARLAASCAAVVSRWTRSQLPTRCAGGLDRRPPIV